jgi:ABC-type transport system involved in cytochrome bd biosynthesis fused ATPase/permease subunit
MDLPGHVVDTRRDGRRTILLHRAMAVISAEKIEIKSARGTVILPFIGIVLAAGAIAGIVLGGSSLPFWLLTLLLVFLLILVPFSVMSLISAIAGADVVVDRKKGSATWQQGYLGMGIGTKELVPFAKIDHFEITIEGGDADRWHEHQDDLRQFALVLVKVSGKRLTIAQVPVPAYGQADGMDRTLAVGNAVATLTGSTVQIPDGWELVEIDTKTGDIVPEKPAPQSKRRMKTKGRR